MDVIAPGGPDDGAAVDSIVIGIHRDPCGSAALGVILQGAHARGSFLNDFSCGKGNVNSFFS